jgi:hypothetical protein
MPVDKLCGRTECTNRRNKQNKAYTWQDAVKEFNADEVIERLMQPVLFNMSINQPALAAKYMTRAVSKIGCWSYKLRDAWTEN